MIFSFQVGYLNQKEVEGSMTLKNNIMPSSTDAQYDGFGILNSSVMCRMRPYNTERYQTHPSYIMWIRFYVSSIDLLHKTPLFCIKNDSFVGKTNWASVVCCIHWCRFNRIYIRRAHFEKFNLKMMFKFKVK